MAKRCTHLSASSIAAFKACPVRFRINYVEGLRLIEEPEVLRVGTNWHGMQQVYRNTLIDLVSGNDPMLTGSGTPVELDPASKAFVLTIDWLNDRYSIIPDNMTPTDWAVERAILAASFAGYVWYYQNDEAETIATEIPFELPLMHPKTGMPLPVEDVVRVGKIDRIVRREQGVMNWEYKSTGSDIDPSSDYWKHLHLDTQISMYASAMRDLHAGGALEQYGIVPDEVLAGTMYDVWHKPKISPKALTQKDTKEFVSTEKYMGTDFQVDVANEGPVEDGVSASVFIDGNRAEVEPGKKGWAIRETPEMFGARLLADIYERPAFYFQRKEIPRTDADIREFNAELYNIYQSMKQMESNGHWFHNESSCENKFRCPNIPICYGKINVFDGQTPPGFRRIFTDITVKET